jgi:hypothetical protein
VGQHNWNPHAEE